MLPQVAQLLFSELAKREGEAGALAGNAGAVRVLTRVFLGGLACFFSGGAFGARMFDGFGDEILGHVTSCP